MKRGVWISGDYHPDRWIISHLLIYFFAKEETFHECYNSSWKKYICGSYKEKEKQQPQQ